MNAPGVLVQTALMLQLALPLVHSSTSAHIDPSPMKPSRQTQLKLPRELMQTALAAQPGLARHSSMSVHVTPSPENPGLHAQAKLPATLLQVASGLQLAPP